MPGQQEPRIVIELVGKDVEQDGDEFAGFGVVGATAAHPRIAPAARRQRHAHVGEGVLQTLGHLAVQELGGPSESGRHRRLEGPPLGFLRRLPADAHR